MTSVWRQVASHQATCAIILQSKVVPQWLRTLDTHLLASHCIKKKKEMQSSSNHQVFQVVCIL